MAILPPRFEFDRFQEVASATPEGDGQRVRFKGITTLGDASLCVGARILARADELPEEEGAQGPQSWVGLLAVDGKLGALGYVKAVEEGPAQTLLVIEHGGRDVLVPAVEPILVSVDEKAVRLACPPGLLDL